MRTIWKYEITVGENKIDLPWDSQILTVQMRNGKPFMWVSLDPKAKKYPQLFEVFGTGYTIEHLEFKKYIGTWQDGPHVWHLFKTHHR